MRRIVMFNHVSADGYFTTPDGKLDWTTQNEEIENAAAEGTGEYDTVLFGRRTYDMFESFWPHALDDTDTAPRPHGPGRSPAMRAMAVMLNESTKYVFSRTRTQATWNNSHLVRELDPREIAAMKRKPGKDMIIFGSGSIVSLLTQHGLIDEYQVILDPIFLGAGRALTTGIAAPTRLRLLDATPYRTGNVKLRYVPAASS